METCKNAKEYPLVIHLDRKKLPSGNWDADFKRRTLDQVIRKLSNFLGLLSPLIAQVEVFPRFEAEILTFDCHALVWNQITEARLLTGLAHDDRIQYLNLPTSVSCQQVSLSPAQDEETDEKCRNPPDIPAEDLVVDDPEAPKQYYLRTSKILEMWEYAKTLGDQVKVPVVAVLDNGVDFDNDELKDRLWTNPGEIPDNGLDDDQNGVIDDVHGASFVGALESDNCDRNSLPYTVKGGGSPEIENREADLDCSVGPVSPQCDTHGSEAAALIAAKANNAYGMAGVAGETNVQIMPIVLSRFKSFCSKQIIRGLDYAAANGADIANISLDVGPVRTLERYGSWGFVHFDSFRFLEIMTHMAVVVSSGNIALPSDRLPTHFCDYSRDFPNFLCVGNVDACNRVAYSSTYGEKSVGVYAPGTDVLTMRPFFLNNAPQFLKITGTSFSAPIVSGVVSVLYAYVPRLTAERAIQCIRDSADRMETPKQQRVLNGFAALKMCVEDPSKTPHSTTYGMALPIFVFFPLLLVGFLLITRHRRLSNE